MMVMLGSIGLHVYRVYVIETTGEPAPPFLGAGTAFELYGLSSLVFFNLAGKKILKNKRCCLCWDPIQLVLLPAIITFMIGSMLFKYIDTVTNDWYVVAFRVVVWPCISELLTAPLRQKLRELNPEDIDKEGMVLFLAPVMCELTFIGTMINFNISDPNAMLVLNVGLALVEIIGRSKISTRDKFFVRMWSVFSNAAAQ